MATPPTGFELPDDSHLRTRALSAMPPFNASHFSSVWSKRVYQIAPKYKPDADP